MVTTTFTVSAGVLAKAGAGVNSTITDGSLRVGSDGAVDVWITEAESTINVNSMFNFITGYSGYNDATRKILQEVASDLAAIKAIQYDMSGYTSRVEAENMINVLRDSALRGLALLRNKTKQKFLTNPSSGSV